MISAEEFLQRHPALDVSAEEASVDDAGVPSHVASFGTHDADIEDRHGPHRSGRRGNISGARRKRRSGGFGSPVRGDWTRTGSRAVERTKGADANRTVDAALESTQVGQSLPRARREVLSDDAVEACRQSALTLLDAAPRATGALRERLLAKGYEPDVVENVIARLKRVDLLDDDAYARSMIRYCVGRMYGKLGTLRELQRKGVDRGTAESAVQEAARRGVFADAAWELGRRIAAKTIGLDADVRKRRFWGAGGRRGHDVQTLREIERDLFGAPRHA